MQNFRQWDAFTEMSNRGVLLVFRHLQAKWQLSKVMQDCALYEHRQSIYIFYWRLRCLLKKAGSNEDRRLLVRIK